MNNITFENMKAAVWGGCILAEEVDNLILKDSTFKNSSAVYGGAWFFNHNKDAIVENILIDSCYADD